MYTPEQNPLSMPETTPSPAAFDALESQYPSKMTVWYLYHSGYSVQTASCLLIFDYWKDEAEGDDRTLDNGVFDPVVWLDEVARNSTDGAVPAVVVFSSHKHGDHFNPLVLEWQNTIPSIRYVFSHDIPKRHFIGIPREAIHEAGHPDEGTQDARILRMKAHETLALPQLNMQIHTFKSTDAGVAFWVEIDGKTVYHAGDLNLWYWEEESKSWNNNMIARYAQEIAKLQELSEQNARKPDVAFLPIDPRLGRHWLDGYRLFMQHIGAVAAFPMHFGTPEVLMPIPDEINAEAGASAEVTLYLPKKRGDRFML